MPLDTSCRFRFMNANILASPVPSITYSSELAGYEFDNALTSDRTEFWRPDSYFLIDSTNDTLYINDGSNKTITLTQATYTGTTLASHIQTQLNASSSGWTVTYAADYAFRFQRGAGGTLRLTQTTDAAWETLGFVSGVDITGTDLNADEQRNHWPYQWFKVDFGFQADVGFLAIIGALADASPISEFATVTIEANNVNDFTSPPLSVVASNTVAGTFKFIDDQDSGYRFWRVKIYDPFNPDGPSPFIGQIYLGPYQSFEARDIQTGFSQTIIDQSEPAESESGKLYFDLKDKYNAIGGVTIPLMLRDNKKALENLYNQVGISEPFYISIDPARKITDEINDLSFYVYFQETPVFGHVFHEYFNASMAFREAF